MRFPRKVHYGLVFLMQLHFTYPQFKAVSELAEEEGLPRKFLESIAVQLKNQGLVEVKRGAGGGYRLKQPLEEVTLWAVIRCLAPEWEQTQNSKPEEEQGIKTCHVQQFLSKTSHDVSKQLSRVKLKAMLDDYRAANNVMYYI